MGNSYLKERKCEETLSCPEPQSDWNIYSESSSDPNLFVALYDFHSDKDDQLSLRKGERVHAKIQESSEWCIATKNQKSGYVPTNYLAPWTSLDKYPWFHGALSRSAAEYLLRSEVEGSYLVRECISSPGQYCISLKIEHITSHYKINEESGLFYIVSEKKYETLPDLIKALNSDTSSGLPTKLTYVVPRKNKPTIYEVCPGIPDKWELERSDLELMEKLGSGQYGDVYKARMVTTRKLVAVKSLKDSVSVDEFAKEGSIMKTMKHPNLIQLLGMCSNRHPPYIVMEYMSNGNLLNFLRCSNNAELTPTILVYMATQIAFAMVYLESKNYIHRDLAARNCLVGEDHVVKVADFGLARVVKEETYTSNSVPMLPIKWTAPEGLAFNIFSTKSDVWAFGILLFEIVTYGKTPYQSMSIADVYPFLEGGGRMECPPNCPIKVYQLMTKCWEWDPENRPKFKDIHRELDDINCNNKENNSALTKFPKVPAGMQETQSGKKKNSIQKSHSAKPLLDIRSNYSANSSVHPTLEPISKLQFKNELLQKIKDPTKDQSPVKNETRSIAKERPNVHPPPTPIVNKTHKEAKRPQVPPPLPPAKPPKIESSPPTRPYQKGLPVPPVVPLKPIKPIKPLLLGDSSKSPPSIKMLSPPHSR